MDKYPNKRTSIAIKQSTKELLIKTKAPGQCYDGFICQLVDLWERVNGEKGYYMTGSAGGNQGAEVLDSRGLIVKPPPPVSGALGVIGVSGRACLQLKNKG